MFTLNERGMEGHRKATGLAMVISKTSGSYLRNYFQIPTFCRYFHKQKALNVHEDSQEKTNVFSHVTTPEIFLEQYLSEPALKKSAMNDMTFEKRNRLREFKMPLHAKHIEEAFELEFRTKIKATDWTKYDADELRPEINMAGRLAHDKIFHTHRKGAKIAQEEIQIECETLYREGNTGNYSRFIVADSPPDDAAADALLSGVLQIAKSALESNAWLHPDVRNDTFAVIRKQLKK